MKWTQAKREALEDFIFNNQIKGEAKNLNGKFIVWAVLGQTINGVRNDDIRIYKAIKRGGKVYLYTVNISNPELKHRFDYSLSDLQEFFI